YPACAVGTTRDWSWYWRHSESASTSEHAEWTGHAINEAFGGSRITLRASLAPRRMPESRSFRRPESQPVAVVEYARIPAERMRYASRYHSCAASKSEANQAHWTCPGSCGRRP